VVKCPAGLDEGVKRPAGLGTEDWFRLAIKW